MKNEHSTLTEDVSNSPLYSEDLAPVPLSKRTWNKWSLAALWVGMAVCVPTYMLAAQIIMSGINWKITLLIIGLGNLIITVPMVLSGHAGVKYGIPFPVLGRSSFGHNGVHIPAIIRGLIAAVWFGIQTWIGGIAVYSLYCALSGAPQVLGELSFGQFAGFGIFWLINVYFIVKGTESIKWLEIFAAPILILMGIGLIMWGSSQVGSFGKVLTLGQQIESPTATFNTKDGKLDFIINPLRDKDNKVKATAYTITIPTTAEEGLKQAWTPLSQGGQPTRISLAGVTGIVKDDILSGRKPVKLQLRAPTASGGFTTSKEHTFSPSPPQKKGMANLWSYLVMLTAMVGFWATMSISIADITRYTKTQSDQIQGQLLGLPGTMILYSFVGIFVTCAAILVFDDVLMREDAPWDPAALLSRFESPVVIIISQIFLIIATLSTNIAANVIAPANAFSNAFPKKINFMKGGLLTAVLGIIICPWYIINHIIPFLLFVSSLLGPAVAIMICDYFFIRNTNLNVNDLFKTNGEYSFGGGGFNSAAMIAFFVGVFFGGIGYFVPSLSFLYDISWFVGFGVSFILYFVLMRGKVKQA